MKYIKKFKTDSEFQSFKGSKDYVTPNISHIVETENNTLRKNIKFTIDGKEYNVGKHMTWEEWIGHDNHAHYNNDFFTLRTGEVIDKEENNVSKDNMTHEIYNNYIMPYGEYNIQNAVETEDVRNVIYYTSSDNNPITPSITNIVSNTYENGIGSIICDNKITSIPSSAFKDCTTLTSITIPDSVTSISDSAFSGCTGLKTITIPDSVVSISTAAFYGCTGLVGELYLPDSVTSIGQNTFYGCTGLTRLRLPNNLQSGGSQMFAACSGITGELDIPYGWTTIPQRMFMWCNGITKVNIPNTVSTIGEDAFWYCTGLTGELVLPDSVTTIQSDAFYGCSGLTSIRFSNNLQSIGDGAFSSCNGLVDIVIPDSVTVFSGSPFQSCSGLESITIGNGVKKLGQYCFRYCKKLHTVVLPDNLIEIGRDAFYGCSALININIPNKLEHIGYEAFAGCSGLSGDLILPSTLKSLGSYAFSGCSNITSVTILSDSLQISDINDDFLFDAQNPFNSCRKITHFYTNFSHCDNTVLIMGDVLLSIAPGSTLTELEIPNGITRIASRAAYGCSNLKKVILPNTLTIIDSLSFDSSGISGELTIPSSVQEIRSQAFYSTPLQTVKMEGATPISIQGYAFDSDVKIYVADNMVDTFKTACASYQKQFFGDGTNITDTTTFLYTTTDNQIITPTNYNIVNNEYNDGQGTLEVLGRITIIGKEWNLPNLNSLIIPDGVTYITSNAFENCTSLTQITIPNTIRNFGSYAFYGCSNLTSTITIPDGVTKIEPYVFYNCSQMNGNLIIPNSVTHIGTYAFYGCSGFTGTLNIPNSVKKIDEAAFYGCSGLTGELIIPHDITALGQIGSFGEGFHFYGCSGLTNIIFNDNITRLGRSVFANCTGLTNVTIPDSVTELGDGVFSGCTNLLELTLPQNLTHMGYMQRYGAQHITIPNGITKLQNSHFYNCTNLKSITLPDTLNYIDLGAFGGCTNLERVNVSDISAWCQIKHYDDDANPLYYAKNLYLNGELLTNLVIPEGVTEINAYAFINCQSLQSVTLPVSLQTIGKQAFYGCKNLTNINISSGLKTINAEAFSGCTSLERVNVSDISAWCQIRSSGASANPLYYAKNLYLNGELLTNLVIPEGTTHINEYAFYNCSGLTGGVNLPNSITSIGQYAFYNCSGLTGELRIPNSVPSIGHATFYNCSGISGQLIIPDSVETINGYAFSGCSELTSITLGKNVNNLKSRVFQSCKKVKEITSNNITAPTIVSDTFSAFSTGGTVFCPASSEGYDNWMINGLTSQKWELKELYETNSYFGLQITADNVKGGRQTKTTVHWTCGLDGTNLIDNLPVVKQLSGTGVSNEFPQNLSETESVQREIVFEYQGMTAKTTITQGPWNAVGYNVVLNDNWEKSTTVYNPDETLYDGVYQSFSNKGVPSTAAVMYIDIAGYENFKFYIRSYGESGYDYVMVSQLDTDINNNTSYSNTNLVKAHTRNKATSGTVISNYTLVEFTGMDCGEHRITIVYRKDGSGDSYDDRGYILIPYEQEG